MSIYKAIRGTTEEFEQFLETASNYDRQNALSNVLNNPDPDLEKVEIAFAHNPKVSSAVLSASKMGHTEFVRRLLALPHRERHLRKAVERAATGGHTEIVQMLLGHNAPVREEIKDVFPAKDNTQDGDHAVLNAIRGGHAEVVRALAQAGVSLNFTSKAERSPLEMAQDLRPELVPLLEELGAKPLGPDTMDLLRLARYGHTDYVAARIPLETPAQRHTACIEAVTKGHQDIVDLLLASEVNDDTLATAMTAAGGAGQLGIMQWLRAEHGVKYGCKATFRSWTAMHAAAYADKPEVLEFMLSRSYPLDVGDKDDKLPLHWAAWGTSPRCTEMLLARGANANARDDEGKNALYYATYYTPSTPERQADQDQVVRLLKAAGTKTKSPASWMRSLKKKLKPHARLTHKIRVKGGAGSPLDSRFGGMPYLAPGESWPLTSDGKPMLFLFQVDLGKLPVEAGTGLARVFIDERNGFRDEDNVVMHTHTTEGGAWQAAPTGGRILMPTQMSGFYKGKPDLPGADVPCGTVPVTLDPNEAELLQKVCLTGDKVGGWPHWIQDADWRGYDRLLLQTDTGGSLPFSYADSGIGFLLQRSDDPTDMKMVWQTL